MSIIHIIDKKLMSIPELESKQLFQILVPRRLLADIVSAPFLY